jgi:predicted DNA-binding transcriptional regulator YafY
MARNLRAGTHHNYRLSLTRRIIRLIQLFEAGEKLYLSELAIAFEIDIKTARRDVDALREFYPIKKGRAGRFVYYVLDKEEKHGQRK